MRTLVIAVVLFTAVPAFAQDAPWVGDARKIAGSVPPKLLAMLTVEMANGGPENAIAVCKDKAPQLAKAASEESGWSVRRVSLRNRNPKAVPDAWERAALEEFDRRAAAGESPAALEKHDVVSEGGQRVYRYMRALPVHELCVTCHGTSETVAPGVKQRLRELYPDDKAVGYRPGDIRGAITIKRPV